MKLFIIRYLKIGFVYLRLHVLFDLFSSLYANLYYLSKFSKWRATHKKVKYNDFPSAWKYEKRYPLYTTIFEMEGLQQEAIDYFEFGVAAGQSFKWFLHQNKNPESRFVGFDTFTGLPEDFGVYKKGSFNTNHQTPVINDERGSFQQGLFQQTLPAFLKDFQHHKRKVVMMDADLYSATLFVLAALGPHFKKDDIIIFDQFSVPTHEFKAWYEFARLYPTVQMELIAAGNNYYFSVFKIL
ncbi:MAG: class I SAM-dependent methyltransferase [Chitinophagaceae bacterium]|nr:class I SAM-dependent methyltransferase [Chitinophagaceae bacterium]